MATETVANGTLEAMEEIWSQASAIESLAQLLQKAFERTADGTTGVYGTAMVLEQKAQRILELTGV